MSFSSDLWNGFDIIKNIFLKTFNKLKNFYEIIFSFASLEKNYTNNLEVLFEQYKDLFNSEDIFQIPLKNFISNIKIECEYHKIYYNNIYENILEPLKKNIESNKKLIIKNFYDNMKNSETYENLTHNLITNQENYHNACRELAQCMSDVSIYTLNMEAKKKQGSNRNLISKRDRTLEKLYRAQIDYLNILTESNVILKDYNGKTENILNNLENDFINIGECIKNCLINYSSKKIQLFNDVLDIFNQSKKSFYEIIDVKSEIQNILINYSSKEFKFEKFEYIPFKIKNINKELLFSDIKLNSKNQINQDKVIEMVTKYFIDNKIIDSDCEYITKTINSLKKYSIDFNINYDAFLEKEKGKNNENKNLISFFLSSNESQNNESNIANINKKKEIKENIKYIDNFINKLFIGEENIEKEIEKTKLLFNKDEKNYYLEQIIDSLHNFRKKGNYILTDKAYDYINNLFNLMLESFDNNDKFLFEIIQFSEIFYKIIENEINPKYFVLYSILNNPIFNKNETWHKIINYSISNEINNKNLTEILDKNEKDKKFQEYAFKIIIENLSLLKFFKNNKTFDDVKNYYSNVYKIPEEILNEEIAKFSKDNEFFINKENENQIIKGEDEKILINNNIEENIINKIDISNDTNENNINKDNNNQ